jgi:hypothetical protein
VPFAFASATLGLLCVIELQINFLAGDAALGVDLFDRENNSVRKLPPDTASCPESRRQGEFHVLRRAAPVRASWPTKTIQT